MDCGQAHLMKTKMDIRNWEARHDQKNLTLRRQYNHMVRSRRRMLAAGGFDPAQARSAFADCKNEEEVQTWVNTT